MYWVIKVSDPFGNEGQRAASERAKKARPTTHLPHEVALCVFSEESRAQCYMKTGKDSSYGPNVA